LSRQRSANLRTLELFEFGLLELELPFEFERHDMLVLELPALMVM
jgi:hypothetical protein